MVTYEGLIQFVIMLCSIISLIVAIVSKPKK